MSDDGLGPEGPRKTLFLTSGRPCPRQGRAWVSPVLGWTQRGPWSTYPLPLSPFGRTTAVLVTPGWGGCRRTTCDQPPSLYQQAANGSPPRLGRGLPLSVCDQPSSPYQQAAIRVPPRLGRGLTHTTCDRPGVTRGRGGGAGLTRNLGAGVAVRSRAPPPAGHWGGGAQ